MQQLWGLGGFQVPRLRNLVSFSFLLNANVADKAASF